MIYAKLNNDRLEYATDTYKSDSNELILNFKSNSDLMKQYGFKQVVDVPVPYNRNYQTYTVSYVEDTNTITAQYSVNYLPIETLKEMKLNELVDYDKSGDVNAFVVKGENVWFDKDTRSALNTSIGAAELLGETEISFIINDKVFSIEILKAKQMLAQLQRYADACFLNTEVHRQAISKLIEEVVVINYDVTIGYPTKLTFEI